MRRLIFSLLLSGSACFPIRLYAQTSSTFAPDCCQYAQTITAGSGGNFNIVNHLTVNSSGTTLYAVDSLNNQIQKFLISGLAPAGAITGLPEPVALTMGADGYLYVGEYGANRVDKIDLGTETVSASVPTGGPVLGVEIDSNGDIYASIEGSSNVQIQIFPLVGPNSYGGPLTIFFPQMASARGIIKRGNKLYVADHSDSQILELDQSGPATSYNFAAPQTLLDASQVSNPSQIALDSLNHLYVASSGNGEIEVFTGDVQSTPSVFTFHHQCSRLNMLPQGVAVDSAGNVFVGANDASGSGPWDVYKINPCASFYPPTPSFSGSPPPVPGQCVLYPSPARDHVTAAYVMAQAGSIEIQIWNQNRERVLVANDHKSSGVQTTFLDLSKAAPGVYFCSMALQYDSGSRENLVLKKFAVIR